jgi:hypothetical protein
MLLPTLVTEQTKPDVEQDADPAEEMWFGSHNIRFSSIGMLLYRFGLSFQQHRHAALQIRAFVSAASACCSTDLGFRFSSIGMLLYYKHGFQSTDWYLHLSSITPLSSVFEYRLDTG